MAARDSINTHLFNDAFHNIHGITLDQAREGWANQHDTVSQAIGRPASPEEQDEFYAELRRTNSPLARFSPEGPVRELARAEASIPHPIESAVHDWMMDSNAFLVGVNPQKVANKAIALSDAIRGGQTPTTRIYRGAAVTPQEAANRRPTHPLSFTEDHHVARSFASVASRGGGKIHKVDPTTERGLYIPDIVGRQRTVGQNMRPEREWLIDPNTISGR